MSMFGLFFFFTSLNYRLVKLHTNLPTLQHRIGAVHRLVDDRFWPEFVRSASSVPSCDVTLCPRPPSRVRPILREDRSL